MPYRNLILTLEEEKACEELVNKMRMAEKEKQQEINKMKKFHITVTQILEDYFEAENEDEAVEIAKEAFDEVPIEIFVNEVEDE